MRARRGIFLAADTGPGAGKLLASLIHRAPTFLPPTWSGFAARPSHGFRRTGTMKALSPATPAPARQVSPLTPPCLRDIQSPTTLCARTSLSQSPQRVRLSGLRHERAGSPRSAAGSGSLTYRLPFRFQLLSTPHRRGAVTFNFAGCDRPRRGLPPR